MTDDDVLDLPDDDGGDYYDRRSVQHLDGTPIFATPADRAAQRAAAVELAQHWHCEIREFGELNPVDWYAVRDGRMLAVAEFKRRRHAMGQFPTVFLSVRKWYALQLSTLGLGVPAFFVVRFTDQLCYVRVPLTGQVSIAGCARRDGIDAGAIEPLLEIPIGDFKTVPR